MDEEFVVTFGIQIYSNEINKNYFAIKYAKVVLSLQWRLDVYYYRRNARKR